MTTRFGMLALALLFAASSAPALADPPPWAGRWEKNKHYGDRDRRHDHDHDRDRWRDRDRDDRPRKRRYSRADDSRCREITERIRFNNSKIREIEPTGRHRKALQWYKEDNVNARQDLERCRYGD